uniref:Uncharacterized protein n=1 Tax=Acrobeloides nanus TaxID=290746 RepID=A0A914DM09_9BILA
MASIWLKSYETTKTWTFVAVAIPFSWVVGGIIQSMVIFSILSSITWGCIALFVIFISTICLLILHLINQYRYNRRNGHNYNLREKFQLSENIRFLKIIKWVSATVFVCSTLVVLQNKKETCILIICELNCDHLKNKKSVF